MKFTAYSTEKGYEAIWQIEDADNITFRFQLEENSFWAWQVAVRKARKHLSNPLPSFLDALGTCELVGKSNVTVDNKSRESVFVQATFCKFILAFTREWNETADEDTECEEIWGIKLLESHPVLKELSSFFPYNYIFLPLNPTITQEAYAQGMWNFSLNEVFHSSEQEAEDIVELIRQSDLTREIFYQYVQTYPETTMEFGQNYARFIKATLHYLDTIASGPVIAENLKSSISTLIRLSNKYRPFLYSLLIENETLPLDEQKVYLEKIFIYDFSYRKRYELLQDILVDLSYDVQKDPANITRFHTIASLISQYYLSRYDFDKAISVWRYTLKIRKDNFLKNLLNLYDKVNLYTTVFLGTLILTLFWDSSNKKIMMGKMFLSSFLVFIAFFVAIYGLWAVVKRFMRKEGFDYLELFLPRLVGSVVVGLSILVLENTVWGITLGMPWGNWLFAASASYLGALAYLFLDVHKTTRLLPDDEISALGNKTKRNPTRRSLNTTYKIFLISLFEALGLTLLITSLIPLSALGDTFGDLADKGHLVFSWNAFSIEVLNGSSGIAGYLWKMGDFLSIVYLPKIVLLWAGLSLLIGSFAQLIWQDQQITDS